MSDRPFRTVPPPWGMGLGLIASFALVVWTLAYHPFAIATRPLAPIAVSPAFRWGLAWHPDNLRHEGRSAEPQLHELGQLGVGLVRFDIPWRDLEPSSGALATEPLAYYHHLLDESRAQGMQVLVNLGGYPAWAVRLIYEHPDGFFKAYRGYVAAVADAMGPNVAYYQLGNEFNTVLDPIPRELDGRVFREAGAVLNGRRARWPGWSMKTVINVCDTFYLPWKDQLEQVLREASSSVDIIGYDFYPGNYSHLNDWGAWPEIPYLTELMRRYGKDGAICETGCPAILGEGRQARWLAESPRAMLRAISQSPLRDRFRFAVLYELSDAAEPFFWPPPSEGSFGLLRLDGSHKPAFDAVRALVAETRAEQQHVLHNSLKYFSRQPE